MKKISNFFCNCTITKTEGRNKAGLWRPKTKQKKEEFMGPLQLNWRPLVQPLSSATRVMSAPGERRFYIPVPKLRGGGVNFNLEDLAQKTGDKVGDWTLKNGRGATFRNPTDDCWQGVQGDGTGVIIVNLQGDEPSKDASAKQIWNILAESGKPRLPRTAHATQNLVNTIAAQTGRSDMYNTDHGYMVGNTPQEALQIAIRSGANDARYAFLFNGIVFGYLPKVGLGRAVFVNGAFTLTNSRGAEQQMPGGGFVVMLDSKVKLADGTKVPDVFAVQPNLFTYVATDGTALSPQSVTQYQPE